jgi:hypothetical protein
MSSIFDLKTSVNELSSANQGTSRLTYDQIAPTRDVTSGNFPNGAIYIKWQVSGEKWWIPSRSYLRMRAQLTKGNGDQFSISDQIAPSMNLMANLFQNAELRINDKTISRIPNYVSQIEALEQRMSKSKSQLDGLYASTNFMQASFEDRQAQICTPESTASIEFIIGLKDFNAIGLISSDTIAYNTLTGIVTFVATPNVSEIFKPGDEISLSGANAGVLFVVSGGIDGNNLQCNIGATADIAATVLNDANISARRTRYNPDTRNLKDFELTWTPCLSLFKVPHAMPSGNYCLILNPFPAAVYQLQAVESRNPVNFKKSVDNPEKDDGLPTDIRFNIIDLYLYCNTVDGPRADNMSYLLDLNQTSCQQETVKNASFAQRNYDISPSTYALTVAFQDGRATNDTRVPSSLFKCYGKLYEPDKELSLNRMYVSYAGQQRPSPDASPEFKEGVDRTVQRYVDTMIESGSYFDTGGSESIQEYHARGSYYYFSWSKDGTDRSTRVAVHSGFSADLGTGEANANCLLFAHSKQIGKITVQDGMVTDVAIEDA